jgi:hypothetical protein
VTTNAPWQASIAVTVAGAGMASHGRITMSFGQPVRTGATVSSDVIVWTQDAELPQSSVAVHVRVITAGQVPLVLSLYVTVGVLSQLSVAVAVPVLAGSEDVLVHSTDTSAGQEITGAVVS